MKAELQAATELIRELVEIESPTGHAEGVRSVAERVTAELAAYGAATRFRGDHLSPSWTAKGEPLLVVGHTDTVRPLGTLDSMPFRVSGDRAHGPGVFDMQPHRGSRRTRSGRPGCGGRWGARARRARVAGLDPGARPSPRPPLRGPRSLT